MDVSSFLIHVLETCLGIPIVAAFGRELCSHEILEWSGCIPRLGLAQHPWLAAAPALVSPRDETVVEGLLAHFSCQPNANRGEIVIQVREALEHCGAQVGP